MTALSLVRLAISLEALAEFGEAHGAADADHGYAAHLALRWRYGAAAPQPFCLRLNDPQRMHLLGYVETPQKLAEAHALPSVDDLLQRVFPHIPACRAMPQTWTVGARYRFEVNVRPVVRYGGRVRQMRAADQQAVRRNASEVDAFVAACERAEGQWVDRGEIYRAWLEARLKSKAEVQQAYLASMRRVRSQRSSHGQAGMRTVEGVEAVMKGTLKVTDSDAFADLLARGVGRHVAFGKGMLLLSPAN